MSLSALTDHAMAARDALAALRAEAARHAAGSHGGGATRAKPPSAAARDVAFGAEIADGHHPVTVKAIGRKLGVIP